MADKSKALSKDFIAPEDERLKIAECKLETIDHIEEVRKNLRWFIDRLVSRGVKHDRTKLESPEIEFLAEMNPKLKHLVYGTPEYEESLADLKPALENHYAKNRHHPEHFSDGINEMTLVDIVEMFCDWRASTTRNKNGNLLVSIATNAKRFHIDKQLEKIFINTAKMMDESDQ